MRCKLKNKKGSIADLVYITVILFFLAISFVTLHAVFSRIDTQFQESGTIDAEYREPITRFSNSLPGNFQLLFLFALVVMAITSVISAFFVASHPAFYIFSAIILAFLTFVDAVLANAYQTFAESTGIISFAANVPMITWVMQHFPLVMLIIGFLIAVVMAAKG